MTTSVLLGRLIGVWVCLLGSMPCWASASQVFNGTTDVYSCGSAASVDDIFSGGGTISGWIYAKSMGEGSLGRIGDKAQASVGWIWFACQVVGGGCTNTERRLKFIHDFSTTSGEWVTPANAINLNTWHHVSIVYNRDSTANNPTIYIDGTSQTVTRVVAPAGTASSDSAQTLSLGNNTATTRTWDGNLAHLHVYDRSLTAMEIEEIRWKPGSIVAGLVEYQAFMDASGGDLSGRGNACTVTGTTASSLGPPIMLGTGLPL